LDLSNEGKADEDNTEEAGVCLVQSAIHFLGGEEEGISDEVVEPPPQASDEEQKSPYEDDTQTLIKGVS
jgi:hypothetical protein